jgi:hypothetical protein
MIINELQMQLLIFKSLQLNVIKEVQLSITLQQLKTNVAKITQTKLTRFQNGVRKVANGIGSNINILLVKHLSSNGIGYYSSTRKFHHTILPKFLHNL